MQPNLKPEAVEALRQMVDHSRALSKAVAALVNLPSCEFKDGEYISRTQAVDQALAIRDAHYRLAEAARQAVVTFGAAVPVKAHDAFGAFLAWAGAQGYDTAHTYDTDRSRWLALNPMTADLWKAWQAAAGVEASAEPEPWVPYLSDRADGVKGHYAICRWNPGSRGLGYREAWNLRSHSWASCSDEVLTLEQAQKLLAGLTLPSGVKVVDGGQQQ